MKPRVLITQKIFPEIKQRLSRSCSVKEIPVTLPVGSRRLTREGRNCEGLLSFLTDGIDAALLKKLPRLRIIANFAVGYNNIDIAAATECGIMVTNTPSVLTEATADLTWGLMLSVVRHLPQADRFMREGRFKGWQPDLFLGRDLSGKTLGIIGLGRIGRAVARRALASGMRIAYTARKRDDEAEMELGAAAMSLEDLLKTSDVVTIHAPLSPSTGHLIGRRELNLMKPGSYLINTARGPIIDEKALVAVLKSRRLAGAALDVYEDEPRLAPGLAKLPNVVLSPHLGSATVETRLKMAEAAAGNLLDFFARRTPPNCVNPEILKNPGKS
ncbi:MAG: D-glycerate dehydrogenase [Elusimicrobia bacterium]|nr:D-glycerate dehydrogenase [Elusimicrobiota bacterium]